MESTWYFLDGDTRKGPFSTAELVTALLGTPDPRMTKVWRKGMGDWERAGTQPEFAGKLPPRSPTNRYAVSPATAAAPVDAPTMDDVRPVARLYRRLVLLVGAQIAISVGTRIVVLEGPSDVAALIGLVGFVALLVILGLMVTTAYGLTRRLAVGTPMLWAIGMFIPLLNILVLLAISSRAQTWCKERGIPVGFWGPKLDRPESV